MKKIKKLPEYNRAYFVAQGKKGGTATKKKYGKRYFKRIRALRGKGKSGGKGLGISALVSRGS